MTVDNVVVNEGGQATFNISRHGWADIWHENVTVTYATRSYSATSPSDYTHQTGSVTFTPGDWNDPHVTIDTTADWYEEGTEQFFLDVFTPWGDHPVAVATIRDMPTPTVSAWSNGAKEGETAGVIVSLGRTYGQPVTINYSTSDGTATDGYYDTESFQAGTDYVRTYGTVTIPAGESSVTIPIATAADRWLESPESFFVELSMPWGYHTVTEVPVYDDPDNVPRITLDVPSIVDEGQILPITVSLHRAFDSSVNVYVNTCDHSAVASPDDPDGGMDYDSIGQLLTFAPGETQKTIDFEAYHDWEIEGPEDLFVEATLSNGRVRENAVITIRDEILPSFSVSSVLVNEGEAAHFYVTLSRELDRAATFWCNTFDWSYGDDHYDPILEDNVVFEPGETVKDIVVTTFDLSGDYSFSDPPFRPDVHLHLGVEAPWREYHEGHGNIHMLISGSPITSPDPPPDILAADDTFVFLHDSIANSGGLLGNDHYESVYPYYYHYGWTVTLHTETQHGYLELHETGAFHYTPAPGFTGTDSFTYSVCDGYVTSNVATAFITVTNEQPNAADDEFSVWHDRPDSWSDFSVLESDSDSDGDTLTPYLDVGTTVQHGTLEFYPSGKFKYTPYPGFVGDDSFVYVVTDSKAGYGGAGLCDTATVTLHVENDHPVAENDPDPEELEYSPQHLIVWHDTKNKWSGSSVLWNDHQDDPDGYYYGYWDSGADVLRAILVDEPAHGTITLFPNGKYNYTPDPGFVGNDWFTYEVTDGAETSAPATVLIKVDNDVRDANDDPFNIGEAYSSGTLKYSVWTHAGTTPEASYNGNNSGFYVWNDDQDRTTDLIVDGIGVLANDIDEDFLTVELVKCTCGDGLLSLASDGSFKFDARPGFSGDTYFTYRVSDGATSEVRTARLSVHRADDYSYNDWYIWFQEGEPQTEYFGSIVAHDYHDGDWWQDWCVCDDDDWHEHDYDYFYWSEDGTNWYHYYTRYDYSYQEADPFRVELQTAGDETLVFSGGDVVIEYDLAADLFTVGESEFHEIQSGDLGWDETFAQAGDIPWYTDGAGSFIRYIPGEDAVSFYDDCFPSIQIDWGDGSSSLAEVSVEDMRDLYHAYYCIHRVQNYASHYWIHPYYFLYCSSDYRQAYYDYWHDESWLEEFQYLVYSGSLDVIGQHTYTTSSTFPISFEVSGLHYPGGVSYEIPFWDYSLYAVVGEAVMTPTGMDDLAVFEGAAYADVVAAFTDENTYDAADDYSVLIDWGDGTPNTYGWIEGATGNFTVNGNHVYSRYGTYRIIAVIKDKEGQQITAFSTMNVGNVTPVAINDEYGATAPLSHGHPFEIALRSDGVLRNDVESSPAHLTASLVSGPVGAGGDLNDSLTFRSDGTFTYIPDPTYLGDVTFSYVTNDGLANSDPVTVTLHIGNTAPVAAIDDFRISHDRKTNLNVRANDFDADADTLVPEIVTGPSHGRARVLLDGTIEYTPDYHYLGTDSLVYRLYDGFEWGNTTVVNITVKNDVPVAAADNYVIPHDRMYRFDVRENDTDGDNDILSVQLQGAGVQHGKLYVNADGTLSYSPDPGYLGLDQFQYRVFDGLAYSDVVSVNILVENHAPVAVDDTYSIIHDRTLTGSILNNDSDEEGDPLKIILLTTVQYGTLTLEENGTFEYVPFEGYVGSDQFTYRLTDDLQDSATATVSIAVTNVSPVCGDDTHTLGHDRTYSTPYVWNGVLWNDVDADGDELSAQLLAEPRHGSVTLNSDGTFEYVPDPGYTGDDEFLYIAVDGVQVAEEDFDPGVVTLHVMQ